MPTKLELTDEERELLLEVLEERFGDLREQVHHSKTYDFTDMLRRKKALVSALIEKIKQLNRAGEATSAAAGR